MRPLTETETKTLFDKLANYTGSSLKNLIAPLDDSADADRYVFRLVRDRVYYVLLSIANLATSIARENLSSLGVCLGMHDWRLPPPPRLHSPLPAPTPETPTPHSLTPHTNLPLPPPLQANSPKQANSGCTSQRCQSSQSTRGTRYGSGRTGRCRSCTGATW